MAKTLDTTSIGVSQQIFNTESTTIQHPDLVENHENGHKPDQTRNSAPHKISQQLPKKKGEREVVKPSTPNGVLHNPVQGERGKGETESLSSPTPSPDQRDEDVFEIGDRVRDIINGFKGTVVGFKDDRVVFDTYELGRCSRPADLLFKLRN
jgi:hypothetical protein